MPTFLGVTALLLASQAAAPALARTVTMDNPGGNVERYGFLEVTLTVAGPVAANPFWDATVSATFNRLGEPPLSLDGFCDSTDGTVYRVRFCPREVGDHEFQITFTDGAGSEGFNGTFTCVAGTLAGFLRRDPAYPMHFVREGTGEHFYAIGNTVYGILGLTDMATIRSSIDQFKSKGINRFRFNNFAYFNDGEFGANFDATWNGTLNVFDGSDYSRYNLAQWRKMEEILLYMRDRDLIASVIMTIDRGSSKFPTAGSTDEDRYYRHAVARYAAFSNVTFDLGNEHNEYRAVPTWANRLGSLMLGWNPYDNLMSAHAYEDHVYKNNPPDTDWCGWQEFQQYGTAAENNAHVIANRDAPQPPVNEEYGYEGDDPATDSHYQTHDKVRKDAWAIALAGGYATYGDMHEGAFVTGKVGTGLALAGDYFVHLGGFFAGKQYWLMEPDNALVSRGYCLGRAGYEYVVYVETGGGLDVDLSAAAATANLSATWFNPLSGGTQPGGTVTGGATRSFTTPDGSDWVLYLAVETDPTPPSEPGTLTAQAVDANHADLTWTAAADLESGISGYRIYRSETQGGADFLAEVGDVLTYSDATVQPSTTYYYRVSAVNGAGTEGPKSNEATVTTPAGNASPVGADASLSVTEDTDAPFTLAATDAEGDAIITWRIVSGPTKGSVVNFDDAAGTGVYRPDPDATDADSFRFAASDKGGAVFGPPGTISVTIAAVNDPPVAMGFTVETTPGTEVLTHLLIQDPDGPGPFVYTVLAQPAHGTLSGPNNDLNYTPEAGFAGQDSFTWKVNDGLADSNVATVVVNVLAVHLRINCGDNSYDVAGWEQDDSYVTGGADYTFDSDFDTAGVADAAPAAVYRSVRHQSPHSYSFPVPDGSYTVRLHLGDGRGGDRRMNYTIEGTLEIENLDVDDTAGGLFKPLVVDVAVEVSDGDGLQVECDAGAGTDVFEGGIEIISSGGGPEVAPDIEIKGGDVVIASGSTDTSFADRTNFGSAVVPSGSVERTFTVRNTGTAPLAISGVAVTGTHASDFAVNSPPAATVVANGSTAFVLAFTPSAMGARSATVSVTSDDADESPYGFAIGGTGVATASDDSDSDGMDDGWETQHFGDLSHDGTADGDGDGLSDLDEYLTGTDPGQADTDGDGTPDGAEVDAGTDPVTTGDRTGKDGGGCGCLVLVCRGPLGMLLAIGMALALRRRAARGVAE